MKKYGFIPLWVFLIMSVMSAPFAFAGLVNDPQWKIVGSGDFNGDECRDILWRNQTTGDLVIWYMHGNSLLAEQKFESAPDPAWDVVGVGDLNGDRRPDIVLRNKSTGAVQLWYLNGSAVIGQDTIAGLGGSWNIVGVGDFNGDGNLDILWRNQKNGETIVWYMKGRLCLGAETVETLPPPWNITAVGDFDGDGFPDILWENSATKDVVVWRMHGLAHSEPGAAIVRGPSPYTIGICSLNSDSPSGASWRHIATVSCACRHFTEYLLRSTANLSLCIRAPPDFAPQGVLFLC